VTRFSAADIRRLLHLLDDELGQAGVEGELYLVGGAVMCLAFDARPEHAGQLDLAQALGSEPHR
jgi:hypothetical protein